ncbi:MAG: hypothetical protein WDN49_06155 [Acetobacteraceae bacterium]
MVHPQTWLKRSSAYGPWPWRSRTTPFPRTAKAVQAARDALRQSIQRGDKTDMDRKVEALRREIERHLQALVEKAQRGGDAAAVRPAEPHAEHP